MTIIIFTSAGASAAWLFYRLCRSVDRGLQ
jgi:hypothetical protein